jgi:NAD-binding of NADP-dependent 3-hydroxyisobutyrate dehydrogenase
LRIDRPWFDGKIAEERYHPAGFKAKLGYKDIRLAITAAEALKVPMPLASLIRQRLLELIAREAEGISTGRRWLRKTPDSTVRPCRAGNKRQLSR